MAGICSNKDSKITAIDASGEQIGPAGAKLIGEALRTSVSGSLTELSIYGNFVGDVGVGAVCEAIQSNKETKLTSFNVGYNRIGPVGAKSVAAMAAVTGSLTSLDLSENALTNYGTDMSGIKALASAIGVNGSLTQLDVSANYLDRGGVKLLRDAVSKRKGFVLIAYDNMW